MEFKADEHQHLRYNPLRDEWLLVSPHRMLRPWQGQTEKASTNDTPEFDPTNPLCPTVVRASGIQTPDYKSTFTFTNDFPALLEDGPQPPESDNIFFRMAPARGTCRVMCFHPKSNVQIPVMSVAEVQDVIREWMEQTRELGAKYKWVQVFENKGAINGCSNPHPHCQIWASTFFPNEPRVKDKNMRAFFEKNKKPMLIAYVENELVKKERVVCENVDWIVVVPFWAVWPFETMILPRRQVRRLTDLDAGQVQSLARIMKEITTKYDNIFQCSFPYSMGWHGAPTGDSLNENNDHWTLHAMYYPPLLRSATVKKFMVGYEMLAQSQRDLTPEKTAGIIRQQSDVHYTKTGSG